VVLTFVAPRAPAAEATASAAGKSVAPAWLSTGSLTVPRVGHSATLLADGRVLVAGGFSGGDTLKTAELYDPVTGVWSATGAMSVPRISHAAVRLNDGRVLVIGTSASAEVYDPSTGIWTVIADRPGYLTAHTATVLKDGRVLVAGGYGSNYAVNSADLFDPASSLWTKTGDLNVMRAGHTATLLDDGSVLVARGDQAGDFSETTSTAELYDPASGTWTVVGDSLARGIGHTSTLLSDGTVLVTGGYGGYSGGSAGPLAEVFDPSSRRWHRVGSLLIPRYGHAASHLGGSKVLLSGGNDFDPTAVEQFDADLGASTSAARLKSGRRNPTATPLLDGRVLISGGYLNGSPTRTAEVYGVPPPGTIGPGFTGAWFDPAQSGHGLFIEILPGNRFFASWFAFDPAGSQQSWFTGVGTYTENTALVADVQMPTGGRWIPNFNPSSVVRNAWGTLRFTFTDCDHGRVDFASVAGFGSGSMNLTRLTQPEGLACP
jgi:hypothetical protein